MAENIKEYKDLITEIIQKQIVILGPDIAVSQARNVAGLIINDDGVVTELEGSPKEVVQKLIDEYVSLSGLIVKQAMGPLLAKYPSLKIE